MMGLTGPTSQNLVINNTMVNNEVIMLLTMNKMPLLNILFKEVIISQ